MSEAPSASKIPANTSAADFDVHFGKVDGQSREKSYESTFHTSEMDGNDPVFEEKAVTMEASAGTLEADEEAKETEQEKKNEVTTEKEAKEAAL